MIPQYPFCEIKGRLDDWRLFESVQTSAQLGRSWVNGIVFGQSETDGLQGGTVELVGDASSERLKTVHLTVTTDDHGKYAIRDVPYGSYHFHVSAPGFRPYEVEIYVASDAQTALHVRLRAAGTQ